MQLRRDREIAAAQAFLRKAPDSNGDRLPRTVTLDGHVPSRSVLWRLRREHVTWRHVRVRTCKYLNNIVEQDHRGIKARCGPTKGFKSFATDGAEVLVPRDVPKPPPALARS